MRTGRRGRCRRCKSACPPQVRDWRRTGGRMSGADPFPVPDLRDPHPTTAIPLRSERATPRVGRPTGSVSTGSGRSFGWIIRPPPGRGATDRSEDWDSGVRLRTPAPLPHRSCALPLIVIRRKWGSLRLSVPRRVPPRYPDCAIGTDTGCSASTDLPPGHGCPVEA